MTINQWGIYIYYIYYIIYIYISNILAQEKHGSARFFRARSFAALGAAGVCGGSQADPDVVDPNASNAVPGERQLERTEGHPRCLAVEAMARLDSQGCGVIIIISIFTIVIIVIIIISVLFLLLVNFIIMLYNYYRVLQKKQPST